MKTVRLDNNTVTEIIPDYALPVAEWYGEVFAAQCMEAPDEVDQRWVYDPATATFSPPPPPSPPGPRQPTDLELAQQEITDKDLEIIANAQALTDLELMMIGGIASV